MAVDKYGKKVDIGAKIKLLYIDPIVTEYLPEDEKREIESMVNDTLFVYEVSEKYTYVEKKFGEHNGRSNYHRMSLIPEQFELLD